MSEVPAGWRLTTLGEVGNFTTSSVDKISRFTELPIDLVNYMDVYGRNFISSDMSFMRVTANATQHQRSGLIPGDILFTPSSETPDDIGHAAVIVSATPRMLHSYHTVRFRPRSGELDVAFSGYFAHIDDMRIHFRRRATGSTRYTLSIADFGEAELRVPPIEEQANIASVLRTLDEKIASTSAIVAKLKVVNRGVLEDLVTRGVDQTGGLRPPLEGARRSYRATSLGSIPQGWTHVGLGDCLAGSPTNGIYKPASLIGRGSLLVGQTALTEERHIDYTRARRAQITSEELARYELRPGDVLVSRVYATLAGVGMPALVTDLPEQAVFESNMMRLRFSRSVMESTFGFWMLQTNAARAQIRRAAQLSNQASINQQALHALVFALPPLDEQRRIREVIDGVESRRRAEERSLAGLLLLRVGLMADLLTGRVRIRGNEVAA
jgi:type I restriction enzyme, S subunit